jgi:hypothetical protein
MRARLAILIAAAGLSVGGCAYNGLGVGLGYGDPYGYGYGPYSGYGAYDPYFDYTYGRPGYGYSMPYGWYGGYYYPGTGYYVYDQYRNPFYWTDIQRRHWESQPHHSSWTRANWSAFAQHRSGAATTTTTSSLRTRQIMSEPTTSRSFTTRSSSRSEHSDHRSSSDHSFRNSMRHVANGDSRQD